MYTVADVIRHLAQEPLTVLVVSDTGSIVALERPEVGVPTQKLLDNVMTRYPRCATSFLPRGAYSEERVREILAESIDAVRRNREVLLKPGANLRVKDPANS